MTNDSFITDNNVSVTKFQKLSNMTLKLFQHDTLTSKFITTMLQTELRKDKAK